MNNFLQRNSSIIAWLGGLGIPVAVILAGWLITSGSESSKLESQYVQMALSILTAREKPSDGVVPPFTDEEKALRQWAVRLLNKKSPEKFTDEEQKALLNVRKPFGSVSSTDQSAEDAISVLIGRVLFQGMREQSKTSPTPTPRSK